MRRPAAAPPERSVDWASEVRRRLPPGVQRDAVRATEEIAQHLTARYDEALALGLDVAQARALALEELADWTPQKHHGRRDWRARLAGAWFELRQGPRFVRREPAFAATVVAILGGALAATLALFALVDVLLLRPLPLAGADRLLLLGEGVPALGAPNLPFSPPDFEDLRAAQRSYSHVAAFLCEDLEGRVGPGDARRVQVTRASASLFETLSVQARVGRVFSAQEERSAVRVAVVSDAFWQRALGGDRDALARTLYLERRAYTIIGVLPAGLRFPLPGRPQNWVPADVYVPLAFAPEELQARGSHFNYSVLARLRDGVSLMSARAELPVLAARSLALYPSAVRDALGGAPLVWWARPLRDEVTGPSRPAALLLLAAVALLLLIGCANVANLTLVRAMGRRRELALRAALGASRARLLGQLLAESAVLAVAAAGVGLAGAWALTRLLPGLLPLPTGDAPPIDARVALAGLLLAAASTLGAGLFPALVGTGRDLIGSLRDGRSATASPARRRWQRALVVAQVAVALALLVTTGLLGRSLANLLDTDPGFRTARLASASVALPSVAYPQAADVRGLYGRLLAAMNGEAAVEAVALGTDMPLAAREYAVAQVEDQPPSAGQVATSTFTWTLGPYIETLGIALRQGRGFDVGDVADGLPVALVNEAFVQRHWPDGRALGRRVRHGSGEAWATVVGVVADVKTGALWEPAQPHVYLPFAQAPDRLVADDVARPLRVMMIAVRAHAAAEDILPVLRRSVHTVDPQLALTDVRLASEALAEATRLQRASSAALAAFALAALVLAAVGLYGVVAYQVALRRRELGVRAALGADARRLIVLSSAEGLRLTLVGVAIGLALTGAGARLLGGLLYGVSSADPIVYAGTALLLIAVAGVAAWLPARQAARIDVCASLRAE